MSHTTHFLFHFSPPHVFKFLTVSGFIFLTSNSADTLFSRRLSAWLSLGFMPGRNLKPSGLDLISLFLAHCAVSPPPPGSSPHLVTSRVSYVSVRFCPRPRTSAMTFYLWKILEVVFDAMYTTSYMWETKNSVHFEDSLQLRTQILKIIFLF